MTAMSKALCQYSESVGNDFIINETEIPDGMLLIVKESPFQCIHNAEQSLISLKGYTKPMGCASSLPCGIGLRFRCRSRANIAIG